MSVNRFIKLSKIKNKVLPKAMVCFGLLFLFSSFQVRKEMSESTIKALFIYNFTKYVEWPTEKEGDHFVIGFYGTSAITEELKQICVNKKVKNKCIEIRTISDFNEMEKCDILFIPKNQTEYLKKINEVVDGKEVLLVTEEKGMALKGASVNIVEKEEKFRFELNEAAIKRTGLKISSQLLPLAILVKEEGL